jgi:hypothetical protein
MFETVYHIPLNHELPNFYFNGDSDESWRKCVLEHLQSRFHYGLHHQIRMWFTFDIYNITNDSIMLKVASNSVEDEDDIPSEVFDYIEECIVTRLVPEINIILSELSFTTLPKNAPFFFDDNRIWVLMDYCKDTLEYVSIRCKEEVE